jgi:MFS family permease
VLNFVTMPGLVGPILGPVLGGVFVTWASWHWIFLINIPIGVAGLLYARKYMPNFTTPRRSFDMGGFFLFGLSLVLFSSGMELFGEKIVATWMALSVILAVFCFPSLYTSRAPSPDAVNLLGSLTPERFPSGLQETLRRVWGRVAYRS